ncbi:MAG: carboxymuconolactone decarboxylase family protein [Bacteroidales bacterium]
MIQSPDTLNELFEVLGLETAGGEMLADVASPKYLRDLKLNLKATLKSDHLSEKECMLLGIALSVNAGKPLLVQSLRVKALQAGASEEEVSEVVSCASLMAANNVFYRFRHFMQDEKYNNLPARFRMNIMMAPINGKEFFELISLAISVVNGCEMCVRSHEASLRQLGTAQERIFDAIRLASVMESAAKLL